MTGTAGPGKTDGPGSASPASRLTRTESGLLIMGIAPAVPPIVLAVPVLVAVRGRLGRSGP